jgi:hypothetical protein
VGALFDAGYGEGAPRPGRALLEEESHVLVLEPPRIDARPSHSFEVHRKIEKIPELLAGIFVQ